MGSVRGGSGGRDGRSAERCAVPELGVESPAVTLRRPDLSKFDPDGAYVRRWVPELAKLPDKFLHAPWTAPAEILEYTGVDLGATYPEPIVDHAEARAEALAAFKQLRGAKATDGDD